MARRRRTAGDYWRVQGERVADVSQLGPFDEIVVGETQERSWLHAEMMDDRSAWVRIADRCFWVYAPSKGWPYIVDEETRPYTKFVRCRKRPGGKRCVLVRGHQGRCIGEDRA